MSDRRLRSCKMGNTSVPDGHPFPQKLRIITDYISEPENVHNLILFSLTWQNTAGMLQTLKTNI